MTVANSQYKTFAVNMRRITGLGADAAGSLPDERHLESGGYHVGKQDIRRIGRWLKDYSTRQSRDRVDDGTNWSSGFDIGDDWPNGGRPAWLRWNNLLLRGLINKDPALTAVRAINMSRDGKERKRYDTNNRSQGLIDSTDGVTWHTHGETWRDQIGKPALDRAFRRIEQMAVAAIANRPLAAEPGEDDVELTDSVPVPAWDAVPADWNTTATPNEVQTVATILGGLHRREYTALYGLIKVYDVVKALQTTPPQAVVQLSPAQMDQLRTDIMALISSTLAAKIGVAVELALAGPAGQTALKAAANAAEDS